MLSQLCDPGNSPVSSASGARRATKCLLTGCLLLLNSVPHALRLGQQLAQSLLDRFTSLLEELAKLEANPTAGIKFSLLLPFYSNDYPEIRAMHCHLADMIVANHDRVLYLGELESNGSRVIEYVKRRMYAQRFHTW